MTKVLLPYYAAQPKIPGNLIEAHLSGLRKAIEPARSNPNVIARSRRDIYDNLDRSRRETLGLCLWGHATHPSVFQWRLRRGQFGFSSKLTITQSQIGNGFVPRVQEFSAIYLVHPNATIPFTPSRTFGEIPISDISLVEMKEPPVLCLPPIARVNPSRLNVSE